MAFLTPICIPHIYHARDATCARRVRMQAQNDLHNDSRLHHSQQEGATQGAQPPPLDAKARPVSSTELKTELYTTIASLNRGFCADRTARETVAGLVRELEASNVCKTPTRDEGLVGEWRLLYTSALDVLGLATLSPVAQVGQVFQNVRCGTREGEFEIENVVELQSPLAAVTNSFFGDSVVVITVTARGVRQSGTRIDIQFTRSAVATRTVLGRDVSFLPKVGVPVRSGMGFIDTTYLDADIRVARAPDLPLGLADNFYVLVRDMS